MQVTGGDHHRVEILDSKQLAVGDELLRVAAEPLLHKAVGGFARDTPRIGERDDLEVGLFDVPVDSLHVGVAAAVPAADDADADAVVGAERAPTGGGADR
jgi:hypothetical protein